MLVSVKITGVTALLMHRFSENGEPEKPTRRIQINPSDPRVEAEKSANRDAAGNLYFPGAAISRLLRDAGAGHKQRGSRRSLRFIVPAAVLVTEDTVAVLDPETMKPLRGFEVDARPVTIPSTKGRVMRYRPRFNAWAASFSLEISEEILPVDVVHQLLTEGGQQIGIGDFRPEKGGPFGRFRVTEWKQA